MPCVNISPDKIFNTDLRGTSLFDTDKPVIPIDLPFQTIFRSFKFENRIWADFHGDWSNRCQAVLDLYRFLNPCLIPLIKWQEFSIVCVTNQIPPRIYIIGSLVSPSSTELLLNLEQSVQKLHRRLWREKLKKRKNQPSWSWAKILTRAVHQARHQNHCRRCRLSRKFQERS
jgi:hypothetical protein